MSPRYALYYAPSAASALWRFGSQVLVLSLDVKRAAGTRSGFVVTTHGGRTATDLDALDWAREAIDRGVGELLVNSIDADGTKDGFDLELVGLMRELSSVPVIASGGAGAVTDFAPALRAGADAVEGERHGGDHASHRRHVTPHDRHSAGVGMAPARAAFATT